MRSIKAMLLGRGMLKFVMGWLAATLLIPVLKTIAQGLTVAFVVAPVARQLGEPDNRFDALNYLAASFVPEILIRGPALLLSFGIAVLVSRRFPTQRLGIFALAGSVAQIAPSLAVAGLSLLVFLWKNYLVDILIGAVAGLIGGWVTRPTKNTLPLLRASGGS